MYANGSTAPKRSQDFLDARACKAPELARLYGSGQPCQCPDCIAARAQISTGTVSPERTAAILARVRNDVFMGSLTGPLSTKTVDLMHNARHRADSIVRAGAELAGVTVAGDDSPRYTLTENGRLVSDRLTADALLDELDYLVGNLAGPSTLVFTVASTIGFTTRKIRDDDSRTLP